MYLLHHRCQLYLLAGISKTFKLLTEWVDFVRTLYVFL